MKIGRKTKGICNSVSAQRILTWSLFDDFVRYKVLYNIYTSPPPIESSLTCHKSSDGRLFRLLPVSAVPGADAAAAALNCECKYLYALDGYWRTSTCRSDRIMRKISHSFSFFVSKCLRPELLWLHTEWTRPVDRAPSTLVGNINNVVNVYKSSFCTKAYKPQSCCFF